MSFCPQWGRPFSQCPFPLPHGLYPLGTVPSLNPAQNHKSGRYASYWNAFLLQITFEVVIPLIMLKYWVTFHMDVQSITLRIPLLVKFRFYDLRVHSHLRFIRYELLRELFSSCNREKQPIIELFSPHKVDQIPSVYALA